MSTVFLWFGGFLVTFLCLTVLTTVITGMAGISHYETMTVTYKAYCLISGIVATLCSIVYAYEIKLVKTEHDNE